VVTLFEGRIHDGSMENLFHGRVRHTPDGPIFDSGSINVAVSSGHDKAMTAAIPPESIIVSLDSDMATSARNCLEGTITSVRERNGSVDMGVNIGEPLVARITQTSYERMDLKLGQKVWLVFKAESVKLY